MTETTDAIRTELMRLWAETAAQLPAKRRRTVRRMFGMAGALNASGDQDTAAFFAGTARRIAGTIRKDESPKETAPLARQVSERHTRRLHTERIGWDQLGNVFDFFDLVDAPADMTVGELYYRLSLYMDRNDDESHGRRFNADNERSQASVPSDTYRVRLTISGEAMTVALGQGRPIPWLAKRSPEADAELLAFRQSKYDDPENWPARAEARSLAAIREWERRQADRSGDPAPARQTATP